MTHDRSTAPPIGGVALLERATGYTLGSLHLVTPAAMERPTPCRDWDLRALLAHMDDALVALQEAVDLACVDRRRRQQADLDRRPRVARQRADQRRRPRDRRPWLGRRPGLRPPAADPAVAGLRAPGDRALPGQRG